MPSMANLSLKNNAGTTVTAVALSPSAGDSVPARWRVENAVLAPSMRAVVEMSSRYSKFSSGRVNRAVRRVDIKITVPHHKIDGAGNYVADGQTLFDAQLVVPQVVSPTLTDEAVALIASAFSDALVAASLKSQISPT